MNPLREKILKYPCHQSKEYIESVITSEPLDVVYQEIADILLRGETQEAHDICWFLQDTIISTRGHIADYFRDGVYVSPVVVALESLVLNSSSHSLRCSTTFTLGKIWSKNSLPTLKTAFYKFLESDPLLIRKMLFEIGWLMEFEAESKFWFMYVADATSNWSYLTRWAALGHLDSGPNDPDGPDRPFLELLAEDSVAGIREQARFMIAQGNISEQLYGEGRSDSEREALKKSLGIVGPPIVFDDVEIRFNNFQHQRDREDYHVMELAKFVDHLLSEKS